MPEKKIITKRERQAIMRRINAAREALAAQRDEIRNLESELSDLGDDCGEALDGLQSASDALSRLL